MRRAKSWDNYEYMKTYCNRILCLILVVATTHSGVPQQPACSILMKIASSIKVLANLLT